LPSGGSSAATLLWPPEALVAGDRRVPPGRRLPVRARVRVHRQAAAGGRVEIVLLVDAGS